MLDIITVLECFAPVFSARVWRHAKIRLFDFPGAIAEIPGKSGPKPQKGTRLSKLKDLVDDPDQDWQETHVRSILQHRYTAYAYPDCGVFRAALGCGSHFPGKSQASSLTF